MAKRRAGAGGLGLTVLLCATTAMWSAQAVPIISGLDPRSGSAGGSVMLKISGTGFSADQYSGGNAVFVGPYPCMVIPHLSTPIAIVCETAPGDPDTYPVSVIVDGADIAESPDAFSYSSAMTPSIKGVWPSAGPPGTKVSILGFDVNAVYRDCLANVGGTDVDCIGAITFGDYRCATEQHDVDSVYTRTYDNRFSQNVYSLNCTMPDAAENPVPGLAVAKLLNGTVRFGASMRGGAPVIERRAYVPDASGTKPALFRLTPQVDSVSPAAGSLAGGTVLTITGKGFPSSSAPLLGDAITIEVGGQPCSVITSTYSLVKCRTPSESGSTFHGGLTAPNGTVLYPGMAGVAHAVYNLTSLGTSPPSYATLLGLGSTYASEGPTHALLGDWQMPEYLVSRNQTCTTGEAFFRPPTTGTYTFWMAVDDVATLTATWVHPNGTTLTGVQLVRTTYTGRPWVWTTGASATIDFVEGGHVFLQLAACNAGSVGNIQLAVTIPSTESSFFSTGDVQRIEVDVRFAQNTQVIKMLHGAPNVTGSEITITAASSSAADTAYLTSLDVVVSVDVTTNSGNGTASMPITADSAAIATALGAATGIASSAFTVAVNVTGTTVTWQIGATDIAAPGFALSAPVLSSANHSVLSPAPADGFQCTNVLLASPSPADPYVADTTSADPAINAALTVAVGAPSYGTLPVLIGNVTGFVALRASSAGAEIELPVRSTAAAISDAVYALTTFRPENVWVQGEGAGTRDGAYLATRWVIAFPTLVGNSPGMLTVDDIDSGVATVAVVQKTATAALSGPVSVAYGAFCESVSFDPVTASEGAIRDLIATLPGLPARPLVVSKSGDALSGVTLTVEFDSWASGSGPLSLLRVVDTSGLTGELVTVAVTKRVNASTNRFHVVPTSMTSVPVTVPGTLALFVNGVAATCTDAGACVFGYNSALTPTISAVSPTELVFGGSPNVTVVINGTFINATSSNTAVTIGPATCSVTAVSTTQISCDLSSTVAVAGLHTLSVHVAPAGNASGAVDVVVRVLSITAVSPSTIAANGWTFVNISSAGIATGDACDTNVVMIAGVDCPVLSCAVGSLVAMYPGNGTPNAAAIVSLSVTNPANASDTLDAFVWPSTAIITSDTAAAENIASLDAAPGSGAGGTVNLTLGAGMDPADVAGTYLLPVGALLASGGLTHANLVAAWAAKAACSNATGISATELTCDSGPIPSGQYAVLVRSGSSSLVSVVHIDAVVGTVLTITSVTPSIGSIGGGTTLILMGAGFSSVPDANVVYVSVMVSTTFLNGVVACDVVTANDTVVTCVTRAHMAADAAGDDARAKKLEPRTSVAAPVQLALCEDALSAVNKLICWSQPRAAKAECVGADGDCDFAYSTEVTPMVFSVSPSVGQGGAEITVTGMNFGMDIAGVEMKDHAGIMRECGSVTNVDGMTVTCTAPALSPGLHTITLVKTSGERSVVSSEQLSHAHGDMGGDGSNAFYSQPFLTAVTENVGSLSGGHVLTLSTNATSDGFTTGFDVAHPEQNTVQIAGMLDCPIVALSVTNTSLQCTPPSIGGKVLAEHWSLPAVQAFPTPLTLDATVPAAITLVDNVKLTMGNAGPAPGVSVDWFASRYTFYLALADTLNYTFYPSADDTLQMWIDGVKLAAWERTAMTPKSAVLNAGLHKFVLIHMDYQSYASVTLRWDAGSGTGTAQDLPWATAMPFPPGVPLSIAVRVAGVRAVAACGADMIDLTNGGALTRGLTGEASSVSILEGVCAYVYSSYRTPMLTAALTTAQLTPATDRNITLTGYLLAGNNTASYSATIGGAPATVLSVTTNSTTGIQAMVVSLPALPAGTYAVVVNAAGLGNVRAAATAASPGLKITYKLYGIMTPLPAIRGSFWGGLDIQFTGTGFVPTTGNTYGGRTAALVYIGTGSMATWTITASIVSATTTEMTLHVNEWFNASVSASGTASAPFRLRVYDAGTAELNVVQYTIVYAISGTTTPLLSGVTPTTAPANAGGNLTLTWAVTSTYSSCTAGAASAAVVSLLGGDGNVFTCASPFAVSTNAASGCAETLTCTLPSNVPAASYTLRIVHPAFGAGYLPNGYKATQVISSISPAQGSAAGGTLVTISGSGFNTNVSHNTIRFGNAACTVQSATVTELVCRTGALAAAATTRTDATLSAAALRGAALEVYASAVFAYDPALSGTLLSMNATRGSTAGGTPLLLTGTFTGAQGNYTVLLVAPDGAEAECTIDTFSSTQIECTTSAPPTAHPADPFALHVHRAGLGYATGAFTYRYVDLWSRRSTWGGSLPPIEGDSVYIPEGVTILLDVSPPRLVLLIVDGHLVFDDDATKELWLQVNYILVRQGNFSVGTTETPFPGRARITLWGSPNDVGLPQYGAKVLAVRDGWAILHGMHKTPTFTQLNMTANVGDTSITINGLVNWVVGDKIAIASSSFFAFETDEAVIKSVTLNATAKTSTLGLDTALVYTHLGVLMKSFVGDDRGHVLDMRAEVAVLSRNVVLEGDPTSEQYQFGASVMIASAHGMDAVSTSGILFEQTEFVQMGKAFLLGKYAIHWHMHGDVTGQYVKGCAIHHSYNRALTVHGSHNALVKDNVAYDIMGHTFFLEDGIETGNTFDGNLGFLTRASDSLLNTDTSPATFWITNPNNTYINNVAAGSTGGYGFWYSLDDHPTGPSATDTVCPKFTSLGQFKNNRAHSNMFYGLRVHPEFYPTESPCTSGIDSGDFTQVPAVFDGLISYKNGVKGAIATQVGLVIFQNFTLADNGAGPKMHIVNGKDNGGGYEISWIVDDRSRVDTPLTMMAGLRNTMIISRTIEGQVGTAGQWPACDRRITGVIMQSPPLGVTRHTALASLINVTFVNYTSGQFHALEHCGKCKNFQGGATTHTAGIKWLQPSSETVQLSTWSWGHQGAFNDTDGTLLTALSLPPALRPSAWALGAGASWHSSVNNDIMTPGSECVYVREQTTSNDGMLCRPGLNFRRVMLNRLKPTSLLFKNIFLTEQTTNRSSYVFFQHYNEDGYQFMVPATRNFHVSFDTLVRVDADALVLHKFDPFNETGGYVYVTNRYVQEKYDMVASSMSALSLNLTAPAGPGAALGAPYYNRNFTADQRWYGNNTYNSTELTVYVKGDSTFGNEISVGAQLCPSGGCTDEPDLVVDVRVGVLRWSAAKTWASRTGGAPIAGDNVTIPFGWNLLIDADTPVLGVLIIQGNVTFATNTSVTLKATYILVHVTGHLWVGQRNAPHPSAVTATIELHGTRQTTDYVISEELNLGSKVLAALNGGRIDLYGTPVAARWTKLAAPAAAGAASIVLVGASLGWAVGQEVLITSSSWNWRQAETRTISAVANNVGAGTTTLTLSANLTHAHWSRSLAYGTAAHIDMRTEVGLISSNVRVTPSDGITTHGRGSGEMFGARIVVSGNSTARISHAEIRYGGQAMLLRPTILFAGLTQVDARFAGDALAGGGSPACAANAAASGCGFTLGGVDPNATAAVLRANPSFVSDSALPFNMESAVTIKGSSKVTVSGNVMWESYDYAAVLVESTGNTITNNLAGGTFKEMHAVSAQNLDIPGTFEILSGDNIVTGNVAAGSDRVGFTLLGPACANFANFANNTAHSNVVGVWLRASSESSAAGCTSLNNMTIYMSWDFGVISTRGIETNVEIKNVNVLDSKHAGILVLKIGSLHQEQQVSIEGGVIAGATSPEVCTLCTTRTRGLEEQRPDGTEVYMGDSGCAMKVARTSYNLNSPFTPSRGLVSSTFALAFTPGPDRYPWDGLKGYATILGIARHRNMTFANFPGSSCGAGVYALANHVKQADVFHPHHFWGTTLVNVAQNGLLYLQDSDPAWRNEADCGEATFTQPSGGTLLLNCAGPRHALFRDMDGSMLSTGGVAAAIAGFASVARSYPFDQGTPLPHGPCLHSPTWNAYRCEANSTSFITPPMDATLKPNPIPAAGIFGDPHMFVLESRDGDTETRNFGPVAFNVSGAVDLVVAQMDHGWCFAYTCQKRLSNFHTWVPSGTVVNITTRGSPPAVSRIWWPYASPNDEIIVAMSFKGANSRKFVWSDATGRFSALNAPPTIGDGSAHGAYYWDQLKTIITVKMKGGQPLEIRTENAVQVSTTLALDINDFYDSTGVSTFLSHIAFVLGISISRLRIASVVPGSTTATFLIFDEPTLQAILANYTMSTAGNQDIDTMALAAAMSADDRAILFDVLAHVIDDTASVSGTSATGGATASTGSTFADLLQAFVIAITDGSLATALGYDILGVAVDTSSLSGSVPADVLTAINTIAATINTPASEVTTPTTPTPAVTPGAGPSIVPTAPGSGSSSPSGEAPTGSSDGGVSIGVIVGATIGGVALLAAIVAAALIIRKRRSDTAGGAGKMSRHINPSISSKAMETPVSDMEAGAGAGAIGAGMTGGMAAAGAKRSDNSAARLIAITKSGRVTPEQMSPRPSVASETGVALGMRPGSPGIGANRSAGSPTAARPGSAARSSRSATAPGFGSAPPSPVGNSYGAAPPGSPPIQRANWTSGAKLDPMDERPNVGAPRPLAPLASAVAATPAGPPTSAPPSRSSTSASATGATAPPRFADFGGGIPGGVSFGAGLGGGADAAAGAAVVSSGAEHRSVDDIDPDVRRA
ncbi:hypothetical protein FOA52_009793 [Chlamydomonas sp. UWO 241]|nr:hypothetical protein FOA52_009793 [Chlamydomonas sp. UWO 241]